MNFAPNLLLDFRHPVFLSGLALLPLVAALSLNSLSGLGAMRRLLAVGVRCTVIGALVLALAEPEWVRTVDDQTVIFAVDRSDSVPAAQRREAEAFIAEAVQAMRPGKDRVALVAFDGLASVEQPPRDVFDPPVSGLGSQPWRTNVAAALRMGLALFPPDTARRLVVLSDGDENAGSAASEVESLAALGVPVDVVLLHHAAEREILVEEFVAPTRAAPDEAAALWLVVRSTHATTARLRLYRNGRPTALDPNQSDGAFRVQLEPGATRFSLPVTMQAPLERFRVVVVPENAADDEQPANNEGRAFTVVGSPDRVLLVDESVTAGDVDDRSAQLFADVLRKVGFDCQRIALRDFAPDPGVLADCAVVVLSNISALDLGDARQAMLVSYVRDLGGGLVVLGGDQSFSVGGYGHSTLEMILPVETSRSKLSMISVGLVLVIDRSGSMWGQKLLLAQQAAIGAVRLLAPRDRIGVIAFDTQPDWVVPFQAAANHDPIIAALTRIGPGGGTDMYSAIDAACATLARASTGVRHMIVLTDGQSTPGDFIGLADRCRAANITMSTIAIGPDADAELLTRLAQRTGGRMYRAASAQPLPQIVARETVLASRSGLFEQRFQPVLRSVARDGLVAGFTAGAIPPLDGCVVTALKPNASAPLVRVTEEGTDPLLAHWQVGLGRVVAFTSGFWPRWGADWVAWPGFEKFWTQVIRYAARPGDTDRFDVATSVRGGEARITISTARLPAREREDVQFGGAVVMPDYSAAPIRFERIALDRFEARFPVDAPGTYLVNVPYVAGDRRGRLRSGVVVSYSPEYRTLGDDAPLLTGLARKTGGRVLAPKSAAAVFEPWAIRPVRVRQSLWEDLVRAALLLFLLDVAVRRIAIRPREVWAKMTGWLREGRAAAPSAATLGTLREAKDRLRDAEHRQQASGGSGEMKTDEALRRALEEPDADQPVVAPREARKKTRSAAASEGEYAARLLRAKRKARGDDDPGESTR